MLDLTSEDIEVKVNGDVYSVRVPNVDEVEGYSKKLKEQGEEKTLSLLKDLIEELGMPKEVSGKLSSASFEKLVNALMPAKKK